MGNSSIKHSFGGKAAPACVSSFRKVMKGGVQTNRQDSCRHEPAPQGEAGRKQMISSPNSTASAVKETSTLGRDRKVSLRVVQEGAWGRGGPSRLQTGSAEPQESPIEGGAWDEHLAARGTQLQSGEPTRTPQPGGGSSVSGEWRQEEGPAPPASSVLPGGPSP